MAFKLTYTDGQSDDYDDSTAWEVDDGVLKMGREKGDWTVLVSPSHWATIEVGQEKKKGADRGDDEDEDKAKDEDKKKQKARDEDDEEGDNGEDKKEENRKASGDEDDDNDEGQDKTADLSLKDP